MTHTCPLCEGPPMLIGVLGRKTMMRCRDCGIDWSTERPVNAGVFCDEEEGGDMVTATELAQERGA